LKAKLLKNAKIGQTKRPNAFPNRNKTNKQLILLKIKAKTRMNLYYNYIYIHI